MFPRRSAIFGVLAALSSIAAARAAGAQMPTVVQSPARTADFARGFVLSGDWLQANALPMHRDVLESGDVTISYRPSYWTIDAGALRVARTLSNVSGGFVGGGVALPWHSIVFHPAVDVLVGRGEASVDSTGYNYVTASGETGHQVRYSYSSASTVGFGAGLSIDVPVYRFVALHLAASHWTFSGTPLSLDRQRTLLGGGLSVRVR